MQVVSVNVGLPREVEWRSRQVRTGIYKEPVTGRVAVGPLNLNGDAQADLSVHGGGQGGVRLSGRALRLLAARTARTGVALWDVRRKSDHCGAI